MDYNQFLPPTWRRQEWLERNESGEGEPPFYCRADVTGELFFVLSATCIDIFNVSNIAIDNDPNLIHVRQIPMHPNKLRIRGPGLYQDHYIICTNPQGWTSYLPFANDKRLFRSGREMFTILRSYTSLLSTADHPTTYNPTTFILQYEVPLTIASLARYPNAEALNRQAVYSICQDDDGISVESTDLSEAEEPLYPVNIWLYTDRTKGANVNWQLGEQHLFWTSIWGNNSFGLFRDQRDLNTVWVDMQEASIKWPSMYAGDVCVDKRKYNDFWLNSFRLRDGEMGATVPKISLNLQRTLIRKDLVDDKSKLKRSSGLFGLLKKGVKGVRNRSTSSGGGVSYSSPLPNNKITTLHVAQGGGVNGTFVAYLSESRMTQVKMKPGTDKYVTGQGQLVIVKYD